MTYLLHGLIWTLTYIAVFIVDLAGNAETLYLLGVTGLAATCVAYLLAGVVAIYAAHQVATHLFPLPTKGDA